MATVKKTGVILLGIFGALFIVLAIAYTAFSFYYQTKTLPNTKYLGEDIGSIDFDKITAVISTITESRMNSPYSISLKGTVKKIKISELDATIDVKKQISKAKGRKLARFFVNPKDLYNSATNRGKIVPDMNFGDKFEGKINDIFKDQLDKAQDAFVEIDDKGNYFINEGKSETRLNYAGFKAEVLMCLREKCSKNLILTYYSSEQSVTKNDLDRFLPDIDSLASRKTSLLIGKKRYSLNTAEKINLIDIKETKTQNKLAFSKTRTCEFLDSISSKYTVKMKKREISDVDGSTMTEGRDGLTIDNDKSCEILARDLGNGETSIELATKDIPIEEERISPGYNPGKYEGRYIEVNLSEQMMYLFEGKDLRSTYRVSTGKWSMPTPTGEFKIENKHDRAYSATYGLYMPWWMGFIGTEYGIHELPEWPNGAKEGEDHIGTPVSHGCIRLGIGSAEAVYNFATEGTLVFIHT